MAAEFQKWVKAGQELGYVDEGLRNFVKEQQNDAKEEKLRLAEI